MGRRLKRVSLDFDWPIGVEWEGYLNPHYAHQLPCPFCEGTGYSDFALGIKDRWYTEASLLKEDVSKYLFCNSCCGFHPVAEAICEHSGIDLRCDHCNGAGWIWRTEKHREMAREWTPYDPPAGDGYQMWENLSDGSPVSPVFGTPEELAKWLSINHSSLAVNSYEGWLRVILESGSCCSFYL